MKTKEETQMFMTLEVDTSTEEVMKQMLASHSLNYVLWLAFKTMNFHSPEYLADKITKIVDEVEEDD